MKLQKSGQYKKSYTASNFIIFSYLLVKVIQHHQKMQQLPLFLFLKLQSRIFTSPLWRLYFSF